MPTDMIKNSKPQSLSGYDNGLLENLIILTAPVVIVSTDINGIIRFINPFVQQVFGYYEGEVLNKALLILLPELEHIEYCGFANAAERGELEFFVDEQSNKSAQESEQKTSQEHNYLERFVTGTVTQGKKGELKAMHRLGNSLWVDVLVNKITVGHETMFSVIISDITAKKKSEEDLKKINDHLEDMVIQRTIQVQQKNHDIQRMLQDLQKRTSQLKQAHDLAVEANLSKSLFLANMSHEIRTPLTAIIGFSEMLLDEDQDIVSQRNSVETILRNGKHQLNLINEILDLSKIEAHKLQLELISMSPFQLVTDTVAMVSNLAQAKNIAFEVSYNFPLPKQIHCDPTRLQQIVINLCSNAIKFTKEGKVELIVSFNAAQELINFAIIDTGIGLTNEQLKRLFGAFSQADASTTRKYGGTGLGLHISKRLAQMLGGNISVTSESGKGSRFDVVVATGKITDDQIVHDLSAVQAQTQTRVITGNLVPKLHGHILLAEDDHDNQCLISLLLCRAGLTVDLAENGQIAVNKALTNVNAYDLILMDMQMPVMGGGEATQALLQADYRSPIMALTSSVSKAEQAHFRAIGCAGVLAKPIDKQQFYQVLEKYCQSALELKPSIKTSAKKPFAKLHGHVLVVEDNEHNQNIVTMFLKKMGLSVDIAGNGKEAVLKGFFI